MPLIVGWLACCWVFIFVYFILLVTDGTGKDLIISSIPIFSIKGKTDIRKLHLQSFKTLPWNFETRYKSVRMLAKLFTGRVSLPLLSSVLCFCCIFILLGRASQLSTWRKLSHSWPQPNASPLAVRSKANCLSAWCQRGWACAQLQLCQWLSCHFPK